MMASVCGQRQQDDFLNDFVTRAHDHQLPLDLAESSAEWITWLIFCGRGAGKTRAGAKWVQQVAACDRTACVALVGEAETMRAR